MPETIEKAALLRRVREAYQQLETLVASLSEEQLTSSNVNGLWSVKDNLAHLTAWQGYLVDQLQGIIDGQKPPTWMPGLSTEDEINEQIYQQNKDRPLATVQADFRASYQRVLVSVEVLSEEQLNAPFPWSSNDNPVWGLVAGNTFGHYQEHGAIIRRWLGESATQKKTIHS